MVRLPDAPSRSFACASTRRTSATPVCTAESSTKSALVLWATIRASVVLPLPGGPKKIMDGTRSEAIARRRPLSGPTTSAWPSNWSRVCGRSRWASGAVVWSRTSAESENRSSEMSEAYTRPMIDNRPAHRNQRPSVGADPDQHHQPARQRDHCRRVSRGIPRRGGSRVDPGGLAARPQEPRRPHPRPRHGPSLMLLGHTDVVVADPDEWSVPPFSGLDQRRADLGPRRPRHEGPGGRRDRRLRHARARGLAGQRRSRAVRGRRRGGRQGHRRRVDRARPSRSGAHRLRAERGRRRAARARRQGGLQRRRRREDVLGVRDHGARPKRPRLDRQHHQQRRARSSCR